MFFFRYLVESCWHRLLSPRQVCQRSALLITTTGGGEVDVRGAQMPPYPGSGKNGGSGDDSKRSKGGLNDSSISREKNIKPFPHLTSFKRKDEEVDPNRKDFAPKKDAPPGWDPLRPDPSLWKPTGGPRLFIVSDNKCVRSKNVVKAQFESAEEAASNPNAPGLGPAKPSGTLGKASEAPSRVTGKAVSDLPMLVGPRVPAAEPRPSISIKSDFSFEVGLDDDDAVTGPSRARTAPSELEWRQYEYPGLTSFTDSTKSRRRPKRVSTESDMSSKSEPRIPAGHNRSDNKLEVSPWARMNDVKRDKTFTDFLIGKPHVKWRTLMLYSGQGGTFAFGHRFVTEKGNVVAVENRRDAMKPENTKWRTKHLLYYGDGVEVIGTKECITCVGVYFEIAGNRVFCAHINAFPSDDRHDLTEIKVDSPKYHNIRNSVANRLFDHCELYGWSPADVDKLSLRMVCPYPARGGIAVIHAVRRDFLGFRKGEWHPAVEAAHGFAFAPASTRPQMGRLFVYIDQIKHRNGKVDQIWDDLPEDVLVEYMFKPSTTPTYGKLALPWNDQQEVGRWEYTADDEDKEWKVREPRQHPGSQLIH